MSSKKTIGRPPKFDSPEQMQVLIDKYFEECKGHILYNDDGSPVLDKYGNAVIIDAHPPTVTGLALALGFSTRLSLLNYQAKPAFVNTVSRAKSRVEQYAEERLFDKDGANGAKFSLANNWEGWREKQQIEADVKQETTVITVELVDEE